MFLVVARFLANVQYKSFLLKKQAERRRYMHFSQNEKKANIQRALHKFAVGNLRPNFF